MSRCSCTFHAGARYQYEILVVGEIFTYLYDMYYRSKATQTVEAFGFSGRSFAVSSSFGMFPS